MSDDKTSQFDEQLLSELSAIADRAPVLTVVGGQLAGQQFVLTKPELTIGRSGECDICLPDDGVSRQHAQLVATDQGYEIVDRGSTNGVFVTGEKVANRLLRDDDKIVLGPNAILSYHLTELVETELHEMIYRNSTCDALTGLFNRRLFMELFQSEWAYSRRQGHDLSLIFIDLDKFKSVNDTFGHPAGDAILVGFANTLRHTIREEDIPARVGGEEFAILLRRTGLDDGAILGERLRQAVEKAIYRIPTPEGERDHHVTISAGLVSRSVVNPANPQDMMGLCDQALYKAKSSGRNRVEKYLGP